MKSTNSDKINDISYLQNQLKKYKKRFLCVLCCLIVFIFINSIYLYMNYDYLVFKHFIAQNYIYTETLDKLFEEDLKKDVKGKYYSYFDNFVISTVTSRIRETNKDRYTYLYRPEDYEQSKVAEKEEALMSEIRVLNDKTILLSLTNFSTYTEKFMKKSIPELSKYQNIIIDLRNNYGGDIIAMAKISDMFLPKGSLISTDKMRLFTKTYKAKTAQSLKYNQIFILQNNNTASSSENLIVALNENLDNVTLIGEATFGKGIGQYTLPLKKGFAVKATVLLWYGPKEENIQGKGIHPNIEYTEDDMIEFALEHLNTITSDSP